jgi:hypothetical protein
MELIEAVEMLLDMSYLITYGRPPFHTAHSSMLYVWEKQMGSTKKMALRVQ